MPERLLQSSHEKRAIHTLSEPALVRVRSGGPAAKREANITWTAFMLTTVNPRTADKQADKHPGGENNPQNEGLLHLDARAHPPLYPPPPPH